jgi:N-acetyl-anhydromuramyl-L-alanine amidase AmpD
MTTLRKGSKGEEVKKLQKQLGLAVDGVFGMYTEMAVKEFQLKHGLAADGVVGTKTWEALGVPNVQTTRKITHIFVHCTAGNQSMTPQELLDFFYKKKKWSRPGYHYVVDAKGDITNIWPESKYSNGVKNHNSNSINIAWIGGVDKAHPKGIDNRTDDQKRSLRHLLKELRKKYPTAKIMGHRDTSPDKNHNGIIDPWERIKDCPCFDAMIEYKDI